MATIAWCTFWLVLAFLSVNKPMEVREPGAVYSWLLVAGVALMVLPTAYFAYYWGRFAAGDEANPPKDDKRDEEDDDGILEDQLDDEEE